MVVMIIGLDVPHHLEAMAATVIDMNATDAADLDLRTVAAATTTARNPDAERTISPHADSLATCLMSKSSSSIIWTVDSFNMWRKDSSTPGSALTLSS